AEHIVRTRRPAPPVRLHCVAGPRSASARIGQMSRFFDLDAANETLPELRTILETLRDERTQLIALRDEFARRAALETTPGDAPSGSRPADDAAARSREQAERRRLRLRMQGV